MRAKLLALPLLVTRIRANDHDVSVPLDYAAAFTHRLDGRTNFHSSLLLPVAVGDSTAGQVIRRKLHLDLVAREDADVVLAHLPGDRCEDIVATLERDAEHRA